MKLFRYGLWAAVFLLGGFLAYSTVTWSLNGGANTTLGRVDIGGPFEAVNTKGEPITRDTMLGKPHMVFFGFTHCPDVCPTTLYETAQWLEALGDDGKKLNAYFITVDPTRDTPDILNSYLSSFDEYVDGITGTEDQMAEIAKKWRVYYEKVPLEDDDYTMNHTATTYLMDAKGEFFGTIAYGENADTAVEKLRRLIKHNG